MHAARYGILPDAAWNQARGQNACWVEGVSDGRSSAQASATIARRLIAISREARWRGDSVLVIERFAGKTTQSVAGIYCLHLAELGTELLRLNACRQRSTLARSKPGQETRLRHRCRKRPLSGAWSSARHTGLHRRGSSSGRQTLWHSDACGAVEFDDWLVIGPDFQALPGDWRSSPATLDVQQWGNERLKNVW